MSLLDQIKDDQFKQLNSNEFKGARYGLKMTPKPALMFLGSSVLVNALNGSRYWVRVNVRTLRAH